MRKTDSTKKDGMEKDSTKKDSTEKNMGECEQKMRVFSFTRTGTELNKKICRILRRMGKTCAGYAVKKYADGETGPLPEDIRAFAGEDWGRYDLLFIGAAGIAVRYIAPWVRDKFTDPAVLVMDERGQYVIPVLSGHVGGAVRLARELAEETGAEAVITTATDVQGKFAVDVFAEENGLYLEDREEARAISAAVLEGERIALFPEYPGCQIRGKIPQEICLCGTWEEAASFPHRILVADSAREPEKGTLLLRPGNVTAGIGCRRGISEELLESGLRSALAEHGLVMGQVQALASIDLKKEEPALLALVEKYRIPFAVYTAEELREIREVTSRSDFVERTAGVDNVCERAALLCGKGGTLIQGKRIGESMTSALVRLPVILDFGPEVERKKEAPDVLIFAGTTEGRLLAEYAAEIGMGCYVSTATEYGKEVLGEHPGIRVLSGRMDQEQIEGFLKEKNIRLVIDATHPFAIAATENIRAACTGTGVRYVRCLREEARNPGTYVSAEGSGDRPEDQKRTGADGSGEMIVVDSVRQAVDYLKTTQGNILIATGSKELRLYTEIDGYQDRCFARVLSTPEAVEESAKLGFQGRHLIAMQGPFSREMNLALLRYADAAYFVTKESGKAGGFEEKLEAARQAGTVPVVIGRPREAGESLERTKEILLEQLGI